MSSLTAAAARPRSTRRGGSSGSLRVRVAPAGGPAGRRRPRPPRGDAARALLPSPPLTPLFVIAAGIVAIAIGTLPPALPMARGSASAASSR